jgi:hypothetical protein
MIFPADSYLQERFGACTSLYCIVVTRSLGFLRVIWRAGTLQMHVVENHKRTEVSQNLPDTQIKLKLRGFLGAW